MKQLYVLFFLTFSSVLLFAQDGGKMTFQGSLFQDGEPFTGTADLSFSIALTSGTWSEDINNVTIVDGLYSVVLGNTEPIPADLFLDADQRIITVSVGGTELGQVPIYPSFVSGVLDVDAIYANGIALGDDESDNITLSQDGSAFFAGDVEIGGELSAELALDTLEANVILLENEDGPSAIKLSSSEGGFAEVNPSILRFKNESDAYSAAALQRIDGETTSARMQLLEQSNGTVLDVAFIGPNYMRMRADDPSDPSKQNTTINMYSSSLFIDDTELPNGYTRGGIDFYNHFGVQQTYLTSMPGEADGDDPDGYSAALGLYGTDLIPNFEMSAKRWENNNLPVFLMSGEKGNGEFTFPNIVMEVNQDETRNWGVLALSSTEDGEGFNNKETVLLNGEDGSAYFAGDVTIEGNLMGGISEINKLEEDPADSTAAFVVELKSAEGDIIEGYNTNWDAAVLGKSSTSGFNTGVYGYSETQTAQAGGNGFSVGLLGTTNGTADVTKYGVRGEVRGSGSSFSAAVRGLNFNEAQEGSANYGGSFSYNGNGAEGARNYGVSGVSFASAGINYGVYGRAQNGDENYAGWFDGNIQVFGSAIQMGTRVWEEDGKDLGHFELRGRVLSEDESYTLPALSANVFNNGTEQWARLDMGVQAADGSYDRPMASLGYDEFSKNGFFSLSDSQPVDDGQGGTYNPLHAYMTIDENGMGLLELSDRDGDLIRVGAKGISAGANAYDRGYVINMDETGGPLMQMYSNGGQQTVHINGDGGWATFSGDVTVASLTQTSDKRTKKNIQQLEGALKNVSKMRGVSYQWKDEDKDQRVQIGVIAQEVEKIYPEFVHTNDEGFKSVNYAQMTAVLIEAVKELNKEVVTLKAENQELKAEASKTAELSKRIETIEKLLELQVGSSTSSAKN